MNITKRLRRLGMVLAGLASALLAAAVAAPAAMATVEPLPNLGPINAPAVHTVVRTVGGMAGWQIALIAIAAALVTAATAVLADRALARTHRAGRPVIEPA